MTREPPPGPAAATRDAGDDPVAGDDARLIRESLTGDPTARRALIDRHQDAVYNLALRMLGAPEAAPNVVEETFVKAFRRLASLPSPRRLAPWLLRIAYNTAVDVLRREERIGAEAARVSTPVTSTAEVDRAAPDGREGRPTSTAGLRGDPLSDAFERLPVRYRAAIVLRYQAGLSFAELGEVMGVPEQKARTRVEGARRALAERLRHASRG